MRGRRFDVQAIFLRSVDDPSIPIQDFKRTLRNVNRYAPCEFLLCRGIGDIWLRYFLDDEADEDTRSTASCFSSENNPHHLWNVRSMDDLMAASTRHDHLYESFEKTKCILLESDAIQNPIGGGGSNEDPLPLLLHTMIHWKLPNFLIFLAARLYPEQLHQVDGTGRLPLHIAASQAAMCRNDNDVDWSEQIVQFEGYHSRRRRRTIFDDDEQIMFQLLERPTPIFLLSYLGPRAGRCATRDIYQQIPLRCFLDGIRMNQQQHHSIFQRCDRIILPDMERLVQLAPRALETRMIQDHLLPFMVPAIPIEDGDTTNDHQQSLVALSVSFILLRQDPTSALLRW